MGLFYRYVKVIWSNRAILLIAVLLGPNSRAVESPYFDRVGRIATDMGLNGFSQYAWDLTEKMAGNRKLQELLDSHRDEDARQFLQSVVDEEVMSAVHDPATPVERMAAYNLYLEQREKAMQIPAKKKWWKPSTWSSKEPISDARRTLRSRLKSDFFKNPQAFVRVSTREMEAFLTWKELSRQVSRMPAPERARFYAQSFTPDGVNRWIESDFKDYLRWIYWDPNRRKKHMVETLQNYQRSWPQEIRSKINDVLNHWKYGKTGFPREIDDAIDRLPPEEQVYFRSHTHNEHQLFGWDPVHQAMLNEIKTKNPLHQSEQQDWLFKDFHKENLNFAPLRPGEKRDRLSQSVLNYIEAQLSTSTLEHPKPIGPWAFDKLARENPVLAKEYADAFMRNEFLPQFFGVFYPEKVHPIGELIPKNAILASNLDALKGCLEYLKKMDDSEYRDLVSKAYLSLDPRQRAKYAYRYLKDDLVGWFPQGSFVRTRMKFLEPTVHLEIRMDDPAAREALDPEIRKMIENSEELSKNLAKLTHSPDKVMKVPDHVEFVRSGPTADLLIKDRAARENAFEYLHYLQEHPERFLMDLSDPSLLNLLLDPKLPEIFKANPERLQEFSQFVLHHLDLLRQAFPKSGMVVSELLVNLYPSAFRAVKSTREGTKLRESVLEFLGAVVPQTDEEMKRLATLKGQVRMNVGPAVTIDHFSTAEERPLSFLPDDPGCDVHKFLFSTFIQN